jgi:hypothetical protein
MKRTKPTAARLAPEVSALLDAARHPLAREIESVRRTILAVDPAIIEAVKRNTAS